MKTISHERLFEMVRDSKGVLIVGILSVTDAKARKTNNKFWPIFKVCRSVGFVGVDYQKAVEREANRQGADASEFQAEKLSWGEWELVNKIINHKGDRYLRTQSSPGQRHNQPAKVLSYLDKDGNILDKNLIKEFLPVTRESAKQQDEANLNETIFVRTYKFASIKKIRINGETFWVK